MKFKLIWIVIFLAIAYVLWQRQETTAPTLPSETNHYYNNERYGFTTYYPNDIALITDQIIMQQSGYIPLCDPTHTIVCFSITSERYPNTNFSGAGLGIAVFTRTDSYNPCMRSREAEESLGQKTINGIEWNVYFFGGGATGHFNQETIYRTAHNDMCFQMTARVATTNSGVYEPGTVQEFSNTQKLIVESNLNRIVSSFTFK